MRQFVAAILCICALMMGCATSRYQTAEKQLNQREYDDAIRSYLKLLNPVKREGKRFINYDKTAITGIGVAYWYQQKYSAAEKIFQTVIEKDPVHGKSLFFMGMSQESLGKEDEAIHTYRRYRYLEDNDPYRYVMFGRLDWVKRQRISQQIQQVIKNEASLTPQTMKENGIAVTYFLNLNNEYEWLPLQKGLAELITNDLQNSPQFKVVSRSHLNSLMVELGISPERLRESGNLQRVAKMLGVKYMVLGSYLITKDGKMSLNAEIMDAANNSTVNNMNFDGNLARFFKMEKELLLRIVDFFNIRMSDVQRNEILGVPTDKMSAFIDYCRGIDAMDQGNFEEAQDHFHAAFKKDSNFMMAQDYLLNPKIWEVTHNYNQIRVSQEVRGMILTTLKGRARLVYTPPPDLLSSYNRLQWMDLQQTGQILPGLDSRNVFMEASASGAPVLPSLLSAPPTPPNTQ